MDEESFGVLIYMLIFIIAVTIGGFILRYIFNIPTIVKNLKAQTGLLLLLAENEKIGVDKIQKIKGTIGEKTTIHE